MDYRVVRGDHIIVKEMEKRKSILTDADAKKEEYAILKAKLDELERDITTAELCKGKVETEIAELQECAILLGLIEEIVPVAEGEEIVDAV